MADSGACSSTNPLPNHVTTAINMKLLPLAIWVLGHLSTQSEIMIPSDKIC